MNVSFFSGKAYKFCSVDTFQKIIENEKLRLARADTFNDPYESNPFIIPLNWEELVNFENNAHEIVRYIANEAFMRICGSVYITCFCRNYLQQRSTLMWAHYANNHKGVCFEVEFPEANSDNYHAGDIVPINVTYVSSLAKERNKRTEASDDLPLFIATYKLEAWKYEEEVRIVVESSTFDQTKIVKVNDGKNLDLVFDISSISKVIFGLRTSSSEIEELVKLFCRKGHLPDFFKMDIHPITMEFCEYDLGIKQEILKHNVNR